MWRAGGATAGREGATTLAELRTPFSPKSLDSHGGSHTVSRQSKLLSALPQRGDGVRAAQASGHLVAGPEAMGVQRTGA